MENVVLLNQDYTFLSIVNWKKAIKLMIKEKVEVVKYSSFEVRHADDASIKLPRIIKLVYFIADICKRTVKYSKRNVLIRDNHQCGYCGKKDRKLTIDHVFPKSRGGKSTYLNTVAACSPCNSKKQNKTPHESGMKLRKKLFEPPMGEMIKNKLDSGILEEIKNLFN